MNHTSSPTENCKTKAMFRIQLQYNYLGNSYTYITTITHLITTIVQLKYNYMPITIPIKQPENNYGTCHRGALAAKRVLKNLENYQLTTTRLQITAYLMRRLVLLVLRRL
jgi:hypothetical protein